MRRFFMGFVAACAALAGLGVFTPAQADVFWTSRGLPLVTQAVIATVSPDRLFSRP